MLKKLGVQILIAVVLIALTSADSFAQKRVKFRRGSNSAVVSGSLGKNAKRVFIVSGKTGQALSISVKAANKDIFVHPEGEEMGEWGSGFSQALEADGDFRFVLDNQGKATTFTMTVTVK